MNGRLIRMRRTPGMLRIVMLGLVLGTGIVAAQAEALTFDLNVERGRVPQNMRLIRVKQGDTVTLRWRTDRPVLLHLHGYDIEKRIEPGAVAELAFTARATGRFPIHVHAPKQGGGHTHEAPVVQIEVLPR
jgi:translation initiation factor IF-1